jgi:arylsulfatase
MQDVVLISLDTLRADVAYSGRFPTIERFRKLGTSFMTTVSSSPITPISHASILTGLQPPNHGVRHLLKERLNAGAKTLASRMADAGYATGAVVSCPGLNRWYGLDQGFEFYDDWIPPLPDGRNALEIVDVAVRGTALKRAPLVVERSLEWIRGVARRPRFLFAHFFDAHWPYEAPESAPVSLPNAYEGEVWYMDRYLGLLLEGLAAIDITPENAIFIVFSDHGEDLNGWYANDHGGTLGHPEEKGHGCLLYDATQLVPLIVCAPSMAPLNVAVQEQVRLVDIVPTIMELISMPDVGVDGRSLVPYLRDEALPQLPAYCEAYYREELASMDLTWSHLLPLKGVRMPARKLIWEIGSDRMEAYDLVDDPAERRPQHILR